MRRQAFFSLPSAHIDILSSPPISLPKTFDAVDEAIDRNAELADSILEVGLRSFGVEAHDHSWKGKATPNDLDKARSTIRQFYRDWSEEGIPERHVSHSPILSALATHLPQVLPSQRHRYRILVPGAGLGRLVFDICAAGYRVEGNEISYHQLLASNYILNCTQSAGQYTICPWALSFSNHVSRMNQLQAISVPDIHPATELQEDSAGIHSEMHFSERMSMSAGDFCELYKQEHYKSSFDAVATCFFIDTAPNVINYIETIENCLNSGGIWVNIGPLLWHFESSPTPAEKDKRRQRETAEALTSHAQVNGERSVSRNYGGIGEPGSFELSNDEVVALVEASGFEILEVRQASPTGYIQDPTNMLQNIYRAAFWVARKRG